MRVVFLITFPPAYHHTSSSAPEYYWLNDEGQPIGVWRQDWGHVYAREVKQYHPSVEFEVWRPDYRAGREYVHVFDDGIIHRSFPAQKKRYKFGLKRVENWSSAELLVRIQEYIEDKQQGRELVFHLPLDFSFLGHEILNIFKGKAAFLHTSHLNPQILNGNLRTINPFSLVHRFFIYRTYKRHKKLLTEIAVSEDRVEFFKRHTHANVYQLDYINFDFNRYQNPVSKVEARQKLRLPHHKKIIFSSSRLVPEKQIDKLIMALGSLPNDNYLCVISGSGTGEYEGYLKGLCEQLNLTEKVVFTGYLQENLMDYYCACDLFISTSVSEGGPVSIFKAFNLNIPVMSTDTGFAGFLLKRYGAGILIDKRNSKSWSDALKSFLNGQPIGTINLANLQEQYEVHRGINQLVQCYQKAIDNFNAKN